MTRTVRHCSIDASSCSSTDRVDITPKGSSGKTILVRTTFPYTESHYTISINHADAQGKPKKEELYIGRYFDKDGYFSKETFTKDMETILARFEMKDKKQ
ncbi:unnamed protein product [Phytophthora fragariaefolia]|uniref:Signal peptidase complex subunit 2 n=1 Tax=Phytophthora fragariaefolia TaxID=1490495 RepID=A0A9W6X7Z9_9STRA|nr:unnamed protein product [Phytophthora fragariaefolia]